MITDGDLASVQARSLDYLGARESAAATLGAMRFECFSVPLEGATQEGGQVEGAVSVIYAIVECDFAIAYTDVPAMRADLQLIDGEEWDPEYHPYITACVVNWKRLEAHHLFVGATVALAIYDHPIHEIDDPLLFMARIGFNGVATTTPLNDMTATVNTTAGPTWDLPEE